MDDFLKMIMCILGSVLIVMGCFLPLGYGHGLERPEIVNSSMGFTLFFIGIALVGLVLALLKYYGTVAVLGGLVLISLLLTFFSLLQTNRIYGGVTFGSAWAALLLGGVFFVLPGVLSLAESRKPALEPADTMTTEYTDIESISALRMSYAKGEITTQEYEERYERLKKR